MQWRQEKKPFQYCIEVCFVKKVAMKLAPLWAPQKKLYYALHLVWVVCELSLELENQQKSTKDSQVH